MRAFSFPAGMPSDLGVARGWRCADAASGGWALAARSDDAFGGEGPCGVFARDMRALAACLDGTRSRVCRAAPRGASRREKPTRGGRKRLSLRGGVRRNATCVTRNHTRGNEMKITYLGNTVLHH